MNQKSTIELIRSLSGQSNVLTIPRIFIQITGDVKSALFLSQCCYWDGKMNGMFYKTAESWKEEIGLSRYDLDRAREDCKGLIHTLKKKANGSPTIHYRVDWEALEKRIVELLDDSVLSKTTNGIVTTPQMELRENNNSLTVDYTVEKEVPENISYVPCNDDGEEIAVKPPKRKPPKPVDNTRSEVYTLAVAIAEVTGMSLAINGPRIFKEAKAISQDPRVSPELIRMVYAINGPWYKQDWRGQRGEKPTISAIGETIFKFEVDSRSTIRGGVYDRR